MGLAKKLGVAAVGGIVAVGSDTGLANIVYDAVDKLVDPYWFETVARAGGTATCVGATGAAMYQAGRDILSKLVNESSKLPHCGAALGIATLAYFGTDTEWAYELYDAVMLSNFNVSIVDKTVEALAVVGVIGGLLATTYHGIKDTGEGIARRIKKPADTEGE